MSSDRYILGTNVYRGVSLEMHSKKVKELNKPIMFTEFGADAFNVVNKSERSKSQAYYMLGNGKEIYENASGLGKAGNSIGVYFNLVITGGNTDKQNLDIHDNNASWFNGGYALDVEGTDNNMNEEWFGICAKGPTNARGL
jgi:hypothetical protein